MSKMEKYKERIITEDILFNDLRSFCFIEGQVGLPEEIRDLYKFLNDNRLGNEVYVLQNVFEDKEKIKAIPYLNPDVIVFQTTMINIDEISLIINHLQNSGYKPKEIWQLIRNDIPLVDSDIYEVYSFYIKENNIITIRL